MTTDLPRLTGVVIDQETHLPCGCVIKVVQGFDYVHHPELTFCPLHKTAERLRDKCLDIKAGMEDIAHRLGGVAFEIHKLGSTLGDAIDKGEPHD